ncbi:uncharacterized protein TNCV_1784761 [Trichonephila clavipes]|nr:uncharacterized protein TNCV_1784761 [Trichonephila clavipes]
MVRYLYHSATAAPHFSGVTSMPYSGFEPESCGLQAERHNHHTVWGSCAKSVRTARAGSDVVQSGRPIFDDFFQHLWPYIGNNTANVVFQMIKRLFVTYPHRPMNLHSPAENTLAVLNHKILEGNSQVQNVKLGGHQNVFQ